MNGNHLPETGFLRIWHIIGDPGDPDATPPQPATPAIFPVSKSGWWQGIRDGRYPAGVKISPRCTAWRVEDIRALVAGTKK